MCHMYLTAASRRHRHRLQRMRTVLHRPAGGAQGPEMTYFCSLSEISLTVLWHVFVIYTP